MKKKRSLIVVAGVAVAVALAAGTTLAATNEYESESEYQAALDEYEQLHAQMVAQASREDAARDAGWEVGYRAVGIRDALMLAPDVFGQETTNNSDSAPNPLYSYLDDVNNYISAVNLGETNDFAGTIRGSEPTPPASGGNQTYREAADKVRELAARLPAELKASQVRVQTINDLLDTLEESERILLETVPQIVDTQAALPAATERRARKIAEVLSSKPSDDETAALLLQFIDLIQE
jgi:hypothetical protein